MSDTNQHSDREVAIRASQMVRTPLETFAPRDVLPVFEGLADYVRGLEEQLDTQSHLNELLGDANETLATRNAELVEQLEAAQHEIKQLRRALNAEVTARLLPPDVTERSHEGSNPASEPEAS